MRRPSIPKHHLYDALQQRCLFPRECVFVGIRKEEPRSLELIGGNDMRQQQSFAEYDMIPASYFTLPEPAFEQRMREYLRHHRTILWSHKKMYVPEDQHTSFNARALEIMRDYRQTHSELAPRDEDEQRIVAQFARIAIEKAPDEAALFLHKVPYDPFYKQGIVFLSFSGLNAFGVKHTKFPAFCYQCLHYPSPFPEDIPASGLAFHADERVFYHLMKEELVHFADAYIASNNRQVNFLSTPHMHAELARADLASVERFDKSLEANCPLFSRAMLGHDEKSNDANLALYFLLKHMKDALTLKEEGYEDHWLPQNRAFLATEVLAKTMTGVQKALEYLYKAAPQMTERELKTRLIDYIEQNIAPLTGLLLREYAEAMEREMTQLRKEQRAARARAQR